MIRASDASRAALCLLVVACGSRNDGGESSNSGNTESETTPAATAPLLNQDAELSSADTEDQRGRYDRYFVDVRAGQRLVVEVTSQAFDPILEVTPPQSGALVNDDWQGDTSRSRIELIADHAGQMKVEVRPYRRGAGGAYHVSVRDPNAAGAPVAEASTIPLVAPGQTIEGAIEEGDNALTGGDRFDSYVVHATSGVRIVVTGRSGPLPRTTLVGPEGRTLQAVDGHYEASAAGNYRLQVIGPVGVQYRVAVERAQGGSAPLWARAHHQFNQLLTQLTGTNQPRARPVADPAAPTTNSAPTSPAASPIPVRIGDRLNGNLAAGDARLPSGEYFDVYELSVSQTGAQVTVEMESTALDCFLRIDGPGGAHWENDDFGGTLNSRVELTLSATGTYRIVTTSYRAGETGAYELKVMAAHASTAPTGSPTVGSGAQELSGQLADDDQRLPSGEFVDEHTFEWTAGSRVHIEARSEEFDTYLIVRSPSGRQHDNDDMNPGQTLNAGLDLQITEPGTWRVSVTSYRPGETGAYTLAVTGGAAGTGPAVTSTSPAPNPPASPSGAGARTETGSLAQGDETLSSGEFTDTYEMSFTPRSAVSLRLSSSDFDTYLIVRTPSGQQHDNDDLEPGNLNSGYDIPVAEPGTYRIVVTSYRPGETGRYTLSASEGPSVVSPSGGGGNGANPSTQPSGGNGAERGNVWGLFAGITDYPGTSNDLPECANDARKLAEAVRNQGNMPQSQEFLFTDAQATTANIRQAMETIAGRIQPNDVFVFFYSGHGGQTSTSADPRELDSRDEYLAVYDGQLMDDELGRLFDTVTARIALVAIDACFAGGFAKDIITRPGRVGMFSSEEDVTSAVAGRFQAGGYLSHFLRLGIGGEADNDPHNDILTVGELTHYTYVQFGRHVSDVRMSSGYQHLVVDRGAVQTNEVLWAVRR